MGVSEFLFNRTPVPWTIELLACLAFAFIFYVSPFNPKANFRLFPPGFPLARKFRLNLIHRRRSCINGTENIL
jgi:hypothetical protein